MSSRKQKNLRLDPEYHEQLEELAEDWFNSRKKQGQVVEKLLDIHGDNDMVGMVEDIHREVVRQSDENNSTHTDSDGSQNDEEIEELLEIAENNDPIDPSEWDLEKVKNKRGIDKAAIFESVLRHEYGTSTFDKSDVRELIIEQANYGYNGANQLANRIVPNLVELPDMDAKLRSISNMNTSVTEFFDQANLDSGDYCFDSERESVIKYNKMELENETAKSNRRTANKIAHWLDSNHLSD